MVIKSIVKWLGMVRCISALKEDCRLKSANHQSRHQIRSQKASVAHVKGLSSAVAG